MISAKAYKTDQVVKWLKSQHSSGDAPKQWKMKKAAVVMELKCEDEENNKLDAIL